MIDLATLFVWFNNLFFVATLVIDIVAIVMAAIMIYHIRSKYTAVGKIKWIKFKIINMLTTVFTKFRSQGNRHVLLLVYDYNISRNVACNWYYTNIIRSIPRMYFEYALDYDLLKWKFSVVYCCTYRFYVRHILVSFIEWLCRFPIRRRWYTVVALG